MLQLVPQTRIFVAREPVDFRRGIDGLAAACRQILGEDPFGGAVFLFRNRRAKAVKLLTDDGTGFWLCQKRFSRGRLAWWPEHGQSSLNARELQVLLWQGDPRSADFNQDWRRIPQISSSSSG